MTSQDPNSKKQWQRALDMLREGPVTALALWSGAGIYRASDVIYTLRQYGYVIDTEVIEFTTTRGFLTHFAKYTLVAEPKTTIDIGENGPEVVLDTVTA